MSKAISSYYDWQKSFRDKPKLNKKSNQDEINSLGIFEYKFKDFIKNWKKKNLD